MNCLEISGLHLLLSLPTLRVYNSTYFRRLFQAEKDFLKFTLDLLPLNSASYAAKLCPDWKKISKECVLSLKGKESASRSDWSLPKTISCLIHLIWVGLHSRYVDCFILAIRKHRAVFRGKT
jgi:hypothetical protein